MGGNAKNALTWMDNIGSSKSANNYGIPTTIRDGAPIECTALLKNALNFVIKFNKMGIYTYNKVKLKNETVLTFKNWQKLLKQSFEKYYWIP